MFVATPLQNAGLVITVILAVTTLNQFGIAISYTIRGRSPHIAPGIAAIIAFLTLFIAYALNIGTVVASFITDVFGQPLVSNNVSLNIQTAAFLFENWAEPAVILVVALVIRDRCLAYDGRGPNGGKPRLAFLPFMIIFYFLALIIVVLSSASAGVFQAAIEDPSIIKFNAQIKISNQLIYASIACYILATILLVPFAIVVKQKAKSDKVINTTLVAIIPLLCLRALVTMILVIIQIRFGSINEDAFNLASIIVLEFPYLAAISILCYFFLSIRQWDAPGDPTHKEYGGYGGYPVSQQPFQGGLQPVAQFLGQWGYPGMQPQPQQGFVPPNMPYQTYPLLQGGGYYPYQQPGKQYVQQPFQPDLAKQWNDIQ